MVFLAMQLYRWDFDIFDVCERSKGRPLFTIALALLDAEGLLVRGCREA